MGVPAQHHRAFTQLVLTGQALGVLTHLSQGRLTHIHIGVPAQVDRQNLRRNQCGLSHRPHPHPSPAQPADPPANPRAVRPGHLGRSTRPAGSTPAHASRPAGPTTGPTNRSTQGPAGRVVRFQRLLSIPENVSPPVSWAQQGEGRPIPFSPHPQPPRDVATTSETTATHNPTGPSPPETSPNDPPPRPPRQP